MNVIYPAIFTQVKDKNDTYLVYIPDLDGATEGYGLENAIMMTKDYIGNALCTKSDDSFPRASDLNSLDVTKSEFSEFGFSFVTLVDVNVNDFRLRMKSRVVRRNITLPEWLDKIASDAKINVSSVVQEALKAKLNIVS